MHTQDEKLRLENSCNLIKASIKKYDESISNLLRVIASSETILSNDEMSDLKLLRQKLDSRRDSTLNLLRGYEDRLRKMLQLTIF